MNNETILSGHNDEEKAAYISAIASIATADREASEDEIAYLHELCNAAGLSDEQKAVVENSATEVSGDTLIQHLEVLKESDLKYSLVTDLIAFAKSDQNYSAQEEQNVQKIADYLGVNKHQFSLLDQFAEKAAVQQNTGQQANAHSIFGMDGLQNKMQSAGINTGGLLKGLISIAAPILISRFLNRRTGTQTGGLGGMLGNGGGLGNLLGGGGLGSIISMINGGRGFGNAGGLLGKILGS